MPNFNTMWFTYTTIWIFKLLTSGVSFQPLSSDLSVSYLNPLVEQQTMCFIWDTLNISLNLGQITSEKGSSKLEWNNTAAMQHEGMGVCWWEKLSSCSCCCCGLFSNMEGMSLFLSSHLLSHSNLWLQKAVMQTEWKGNILLIAETGHMLQSDVQELGKQEQGRFLCSIKCSIGSHFEEHRCVQHYLLIFSQFMCLKVRGQLKGVLTL